MMYSALMPNVPTQKKAPVGMPVRKSVNAIGASNKQAAVWLGKAHKAGIYVMRARGANVPTRHPHFSEHMAHREAL